MEKGIAFPTCISINNCCGHFSPLKEDSINLKKGDVAKMCVTACHLCLHYYWCTNLYDFFSPQRPRRAR